MTRDNRFILVPAIENYPTLNFDSVVKSPDRCHCEERSDVAILVFQLLTKAEIDNHLKGTSIVCQEKAISGMLVKVITHHITLY